MSEKQTEAQRLADWLESAATVADMGRKPEKRDKKRKAAAEMRRLEAENEALRIDAECFRFWVREAAQAPGAMASLIMKCTTEQEYRDAIIPVMMKSKAAISRAMGK
jgi:hypothetical protein